MGRHATRGFRGGSVNTGGQRPPAHTGARARTQQARRRARRPRAFAEAPVSAHLGVEVLPHMGARHAARVHQDALPVLPRQQHLRRRQPVPRADGRQLCALDELAARVRVPVGDAERRVRVEGDGVGAAVGEQRPLELERVRVVRPLRAAAVGAHQSEWREAGVAGRRAAAVASARGRCLWPSPARQLAAGGRRPRSRSGATRCTATRPPRAPSPHPSARAALDTSTAGTRCRCRTKCRRRRQRAAAPSASGCGAGCGREAHETGRRMGA